jgi:DNA repair protein RadC
MKRFKTLRGVLESDREELQVIKGLGPQNVLGIQLIHQVSRRFLRDKMMEKTVCHSSQEVFDYLYHSIRDSLKEMFKVLFLNAKNNVIEENTIFVGTVDSSAVYPREVIRLALKNNASSLIFVHNHPSGDPEPSESDKDITRELVFAANIMQLKVLDHIIIGNNRYFSFADKGFIDEYEHVYLGLRKESHINF